MGEKDENDHFDLPAWMRPPTVYPPPSLYHKGIRLVSICADCVRTCKHRDFFLVGCPRYVQDTNRTWSWRERSFLKERIRIVDEMPEPDRSPAPPVRGNPRRNMFVITPMLIREREEAHARGEKLEPLPRIRDRRRDLPTMARIGRKFSMETEAVFLDEHEKALKARLHSVMPEEDPP